MAWEGNEKRALMVASVASMIDLFHQENINMLKVQGYKVHIMANFERGSITSDERVAEFKQELSDKGVGATHVPIPRSIFKFKDIVQSYRMLKKEVTVNKYQLIHCHSPIASVVCRLAARGARKKGTKVLYTAHGFHFYKGAPLLNWLLYYPIERISARYTDLLITINSEDCARAKTFKAKKVCQIPGVGVDCDKVASAENKREELRKKLGIPADAFVMMSVGELNVNKNHKVILNAIKQIPNEDIYYVVCGKGGQKENLEMQAKEFGFSDRLKLVGWQSNIYEWLSMADVFAFPTLREGLGIAALEAMAAGLPLITSNAGGIKEYSENGKTGFSCNAEDTEGFAKAIQTLKENASMRKEMGEYNRVVVRKFDSNAVYEQMLKIYQSV